MEYKNEISNFEELHDICWGGALPRLEEIATLGCRDEFMEYLEAIFEEETPALTEINDYIWFYCDDWIEEHKIQDII